MKSETIRGEDGGRKTIKDMQRKYIQSEAKVPNVMRGFHNLSLLYALRRKQGADDKKLSTEYSKMA